jgi:predicted nucleic acid-binding protein
MRRFLDTNVLVYLFDGAARAKQARAQQLLEEAVREGFALISTQVLQEFFVAVTRKLAVPLSHDAAQRAVRDLTQLPTVEISAEMVLRAIVAMRRYRLSFWDSLILQAALHGGATTLYSEDLQHGRTIETLTIQNPFHDLRV